MKKRLNIKEFSELLGVSTATISRAFSSRGRISEKTRRHIIEKAEELGYRANIHARSLTSRRTDIVGLFYPSVGSDQPDYFMTEIQLGIQETLLKSDILLQVHPLPPSHTHTSTLESYRNYILSGGLGGIIIVAGSAEAKTLREVAHSADVPYVVIGHMSEEPKQTVSFDNARGAELAGRYFAKTGRKRPAYIGGHLDRRKKQGFRQGLGEIAEALTIHVGGNTFNHGMNAFRELAVGAGQGPDCVLCANDVLAAGFIKAALENEIKVPEDVAVIGFDDVRFARYFTPALSTVSLNLHALGISAAQQLGKLINGEEINAEYIECELILRDSA